ncbi:MAG: sugar ABC transporter permease [Chloroflexi bacterium]|nr:sugar ABC transporter permease [Chloroflexota bacterium]
MAIRETTDLQSGLQPSLGTRWRQRSSQIELLNLIVWTGIALYALMSIIPIFLAFYYSLTNLNLLYPASDFVGFDNYVKLFNDFAFKRSLSTTFKLSVAITISVNVLGLMIAMMLNYNDRFHSVLRTLFFIPQVLSAVIVSFIWKIILTDRGLLNAMLEQVGLIERPIHWLGLPDLATFSIGLVVTWQLIGFSTVIYLASLQGIPDDLREAAHIDGANRRQQFTNITWPLIAPGVTINMVLMMIIAFKLFDQVAVLTGGGPGGSTETLSYYIVRMGFTNNRTGYASAMAVVLFIIIATISGAVVGYLKKREVEY